MLERQIFIPASPQRLWEALTEPDRVATWLEARVEWDLTPGGRARFTTDDGEVRHGQVEEVEPGRHLRFRWWPEGEDVDATSEVTYDMQPTDDGTLLTVKERPIPAGRQAGASASVAPTSARAGGQWTPWDTRLLGIWARVAATAAVGAR